jgi:hypothetical protein
MVNAKVSYGKVVGGSPGNISIAGKKMKRDYTDVMISNYTD